MSEAEKQVWRAAYGAAYALANAGAVSPHTVALHIAEQAVRSVQIAVQFPPQTAGDRAMIKAMDVED